MHLRQRRSSDYIRQRPAAHFHHGIRIAECIGLRLNLFVSINFSHTSCEPERTDIAFKSIRDAFGRWVRRPGKKFPSYSAQPTFVWVIENADEYLHAHWLIHVPPPRHDEFTAKLSSWLRSAAGAVHSANAIHVQSAETPTAAGKYMLKGMYPEIAKHFGIRHTYQGWVTGKRIGVSRNLGPTAKRRLRELGTYPPGRRWLSFPKWRAQADATSRQLSRG